MQLRDKVYNIEIQEIQAVEVLRSKEHESEKYPEQEFNLKPHIQDNQVNKVVFRYDQQNKNTFAIYTKLDWDEEL